MNQVKYIDGIEAATRAGNIVYYPSHLQHQYGPPDPYSYIPEKDEGTLRPPNTRSIEQLGRSVIQTHSALKNIFIMGPGAGKELTEARSLAPSAEIASTSYTPVNPAAHILETSRRMEASLNAALGGKNYDLTPDKVIELQTTLNNPLIEINPAKPVVNKQYIGDLYEIAIHVQPDTADVIYENLGCLSYAINKDTAPLKKMATVRRLIASLSHKGVLVTMDSSPYLRNLLAGQKGKHDHLVHINKSGPSIFVKPDHPIAKKLAKRTSIPETMSPHQAEIMLGVKMS